MSPVVTPMMSRSPRSQTGSSRGSAKVPTRPYNHRIPAINPASLLRNAAAALQGEAEAVRGAPEGTRNQRLNTAGFSMGQLITLGEISLAEVEAALASAARAARSRGPSTAASPPVRNSPGKCNDSRATKTNDPLLSELANLGETDTDDGRRLLRRYGNLLQSVPERGMVRVRSPGMARRHYEAAGHFCPTLSAANCKGG